MAIKSVSIRIEEEMLNKIAYVADYEGRSVNSHVLVLIRENIKAFEDVNGAIEGDINPDVMLNLPANSKGVATPATPFALFVAIYFLKLVFLQV